MALALLAACSAPADPAADREAVLQADRDFAAATARDGVEGWISYFADSGRQFPARRPIVEGHAAIRSMMTPVFSNPANYLRWEPEYAEVSGDLGYTYGSAEGRFVSEMGDTTFTRSRYVTIWRRQTDGTWKVVLDIGVERE